MKRLFQFTLQQKEKVKVEEKSTDKNGAEITTTKEVDQDVDRYIILKKPNRRLFDDAELFYGVCLSEGIKAGLLTRALLSKRFSNDGGVMSDSDKEEYADLYIEMFQNQTDIERLSSISVNKRTEEEKAELIKLTKESGVLKRNIQDFEMAQASLFEQTAENRARNKTILWWVLNMAHFTDEGGENPEAIFIGDTHEQKLQSYDSIEESEDPFHEELLKKLIYYVSYWYVGSAQTEEEFKKLLGELEASGLEQASMEAIDEATAEQDEKAEEPAPEPAPEPEPEPAPEPEPEPAPEPEQPPAEAAADPPEDNESKNA